AYLGIELGRIEPLKDRFDAQLVVELAFEDLLVVPESFPVANLECRATGIGQPRYRHSKVHAPIRRLQIATLDGEFLAQHLAVFLELRSYRLKLADLLDCGVDDDFCIRRRLFRLRSRFSGGSSGRRGGRWRGV